MCRVGVGEGTKRKEGRGRKKGEREGKEEIPEECKNTNQTVHTLTHTHTHTSQIPPLLLVLLFGLTLLHPPPDLPAG